MPRSDKFSTHVLPFLGRVTHMAKKGATRQEIADALGVSLTSFCRFMTEGAENPGSRYAILVDCFARAAEDTELNVENALYKACLGATYVETRTEQELDPVTKEVKKLRVTTIKRQIPPDANACRFWIENRENSNWIKARGLSDEAAGAGVVLLPSVMPEPGAEPVEIVDLSPTDGHQSAGCDDLDVMRAVVAAADAEAAADAAKPRRQRKSKSTDTQKPTKTTKSTRTIKGG